MGIGVPRVGKEEFRALLTVNCTSPFAPIGPKARWSYRGSGEQNLRVLRERGATVIYGLTGGPFTARYDNLFVDVQ